MGQFIMSAKKSRMGARLLSELMGGGGGGVNTSTLDMLCACGQPAKCGEGWTDAPSTLERLLGRERILRRHLEVGGKRVTSGISIGAGGGRNPVGRSRRTYEGGGRCGGCLDSGWKGAWMLRSDLLWSGRTHQVQKAREDFEARRRYR